MMSSSVAIRDLITFVDNLCYDFSIFYYDVITSYPSTHTANPSERCPRDFMQVKLFLLSLTFLTVRKAVTKIYS